MEGAHGVATTSTHEANARSGGSITLSPEAQVFGVPALPEGSCIKGCGFHVAPGFDKNGRAYETCCRGCAVGAGHDSHCMQIPSGAADAELALAMQVEEMHTQQLYLQQQQALRSMWQQQQNQENRMWDPLWGEVTLADRSGSRFCQHMCFSCCPCFMIGCSGPARRVWRQFLLSWSFLTALVQVVALVGAIVLYGGLISMDLNPMLGPHYHVFDGLGAKNAARILKRGEWWRLLTPMLLHAGWLHLLGNLSVQVRTGAMLEAVWGHGAWLLIYIASGAYGALAGCVVAPNHLGVGSSGALCGLIGAWGSFILITWNQTSPVDVKLRNEQTFSVGMSVLLILAISFLPPMDLAAHLGGLLVGATLAMALFAGRLQHTVWRHATRACGVASLCGLVAGALGWFLVSTEVDERLLHLCVPPSC
mmetsp:Transcript_1424/g.4642  ORF Transcript_1424/g.4642 Transcript_1424/m.4642 type:complete len:421 (+) Transcript_1424:118-1380(+)